MIKFKQKEYTIQEGHYTGTKATKKIPGAVKVIVKSVLAGMGIGAGYGALVPDETAGKGAKKGAKAGFWAGIALKVLIDKFHKPMSSVKYQKVDKTIRSKFGIKEVSGMIVGDSKEKRDELFKYFSFNDPNILSHKINVSVRKNKVTVYTQSLTKKDLELLNESLDYFCYKYHGMEYSSNLLAETKDRSSYKISIIFTNYEAIASFFIEVAKSLETQVNILDREVEIEEEPREKRYSLLSKAAGRVSSLPSFDRYDMMRILGKGGSIVVSSGFKSDFGGVLFDMIQEGLKSVTETAMVLNLPAGVKTSRKSFNNAYLEKSMHELLFREGRDYTVGKNDTDFNMYLHQGYLIIAAELSGREMRDFSALTKKYKMTITTVKGATAEVFTYIMQSREELNQLLREIIRIGIKPNIYTK